MQPVTGQPLMGAYQQWRDWADPKVCCDYSFHMCVTYWDATVGDQMQQVCSPIEEGGAGINSFKMFMVSITRQQDLIYNDMHITLIYYINFHRDYTLI